MRRVSICALAVAGAALLGSGCASTRIQRSAGVNELIAERGAPEVDWPMSADQSAPVAATDMVAAKTREPITAATAVEIAFLHSPAIREKYAQLGLSQAEVLQAAAVPNPRFSYVAIGPSGTGASQITRSVSMSFADLLFLPARVRFAHVNFEAARNRVAGELLRLQGEVELSWYEYVAALQSAQMRAAAARAAEASAEYARRLNAAGNLPARVLAMQLAASGEAQVAAARASSNSIRARAAFATLLGLSTRDAWEVAQGLPVVPPVAVSRDALVQAAVDSRLDLIATRHEIAALEGVLRVAKWWRWFGDIEVGYERETEIDGARLSGPSFSLGIPIFGQNRSGVLRAQVELERARARLDALELAVRNDVAAGLDRLTTAREIAETYRAALVPQRAAVTQHTLEEVNFMLSGAFEALQAKREQYETYQGYIDAVRDYWLARVQLRLAVGGRLADADAAPAQKLELDAPSSQEMNENGDLK